MNLCVIAMHGLHEVVASDYMIAVSLDKMIDLLRVRWYVLISSSAFILSE